MSDLERGLGGAWLRPLGGLFGSVARARSAAYDTGLLRSHRLDARVISVGNLVAGGAGKTPLVIALAAQLHAQGRRVAVLHRGYRAQAERGLYAIAPGQGRTADPARFGDEPVLVARRVPEVAVLAGADRVALGLRAIEAFGADTLILDDAFQHRRLVRDLDLVVLRGPRPLGNLRCLPAGPLREPVTALGRAHALLLNTTDAEIEADQLDLLPPGLPQIRYRAEVRQLVELSSQTLVPAAELDARRVLLACAVARPDGVVETLRRLGAQVVAVQRRPDHHPWSSAELEALALRARRGAALLVTTEKDAVKWLAPPEGALALRQELSFADGGSAIDALLKASA